MSSGLHLLNSAFTCPFWIGNTPGKSARSGILSAKALLPSLLLPVLMLRPLPATVAQVSHGYQCLAAHTWNLCSQHQIIFSLVAQSKSVASSLPTAALTADKFIKHMIPFDDRRVSTPRKVAKRIEVSVTPLVVSKYLVLN